MGRSLEEILTNPGTTTFLLQQLGFVINLKRISDGSDNRIRISRYENMLCENNHVLPREKGAEHHSTLSEDTESKTFNAFRIDKFDREVDFNFPGAFPQKKPLIFPRHNSGHELPQRTNLLVQKPNIKQRDTHNISELRYNYSIQCFRNRKIGAYC